MTAKIAAKLSHVVTHKKITDEDTWVNCVLNIENIGTETLDITTGMVWLEVVKPWPEELLEALRTGTYELPEDRVKDGFYDYPFPCYEGVIEFNFPDKNLEPGEIEETPFDFMVPGNYEVVGFYTFIQNPTVKEPWGWGKTTFHNITTDNI